MFPFKVICVHEIAYNLLEAWCLALRLGRVITLHTCVNVYTLTQQVWRNLIQSAKAK